MDFKASETLTVRLTLAPAVGFIYLHVFWGDDPTHDLGIDVYFWDGASWAMKAGKAVPSEKVVETISQRITWCDIPEDVARKFWDSGVLKAVMGDIDTHYLMMYVMET